MSWSAWIMEPDSAMAAVARVMVENLDSGTSHIIKKGVTEASSHKLHSLAFRSGDEIDRQTTGSGSERIIKMGKEPSYRVLSASTALPCRKCYNLEWPGHFLGQV